MIPFKRMMMILIGLNMEITTACLRFLMIMIVSLKFIFLNGSKCIQACNFTLGNVLSFKTLQDNTTALYYYQWARDTSSLYYSSSGLYHEYGLRIEFKGTNQYRVRYLFLIKSFLKKKKIRLLQILRL